MASHGDRFRPRTGLIPSTFKFPGFQGLCVGGLDSSPYLSSTLTSPAVMVLTSTGGDVTTNTLHVQSQPSFTGSRQRVDKDAAASQLHLPFTTPTFPVRPLFGQTDPYASLPAHLLPLHHPLLASHNLSRSYLNAAASGAFGPLGLADDRNGFHGSAFMPAKCLKLDQSGNDLSPQHLLIPSCYQSNDNSNFQSPSNSHASSGSIHTTSSSGIGSFLDMKDEDPRDSDSLADGPERLSVTPVSEGSRSIDRSTPEERFTPKRHKKMLLDGQTPCCPICGLTVHLPELVTHFELEVEKLIEISKCIGLPSRENSPQRPHFASPTNFCKKDSLLCGEKGKLESRWETYQRVKANRQNRLSSRACVGKRKKTPEEVSAELVAERLNGLTQEITARLPQCPRKREHLESEDETVDVDGQLPEEFDWTMTARMHVVAQMQRNIAEAFPRKFVSVDDDNQELNVDGDDHLTYGQPHYTEADVITCSTEDSSRKKQEEFRRLQIISDSSTYQVSADSTKWNSNGGNTAGEGPEVTSTCANSTDQRDFENDPNATALKENAEGQKEHMEDSIKCLICMEQFIKPVVSVGCWHVHCEECWLKTLGTKKLCPQCNMITSPRDLRRIYL